MKPADPEPDDQEQAHVIAVAQASPPLSAELAQHWRDVALTGAG